MTDKLKDNLTKINTSLRIISTVAGALVACFFVYMNIDTRMDKLELETTLFKGVMDERTRNIQTAQGVMQSDIQIIKQAVLNLEIVPDGKVSKEEENKGPAKS